MCGAERTEHAIGIVQRKTIQPYAGAGDEGTTAGAVAGKSATRSGSCR